MRNKTDYIKKATFIHKKTLLQIVWKTIWSTSSLSILKMFLHWPKMLKSSEPNEQIEREISLSKKTTLSQSELIQTFFITASTAL